MSNSGYYAPLVCTNPCGEQPLPEWSVCNLGAINLGRFARDGRVAGEGVAWDELATAVRYAVRFLDDVVDATPYFFAENEEQQRRERRIGLGTMGLAELLIRLGLRYGSDECLSFLDRLYRTIAVEAYHATAELAAEKGSFPAFEADGYLDSGFMRGMPEEVRAAIRTCGARNVTLLTQAPTGTTGTMVDTSTGIEPFFSWSYFRKGRLGIHEERAAVAADWERDHPGQPLPDHFVTAMDLTPEQHVRVMATIQRWVDSSISKTCNVPADYTVQQTRELYELMYELGCKGGTIYRDRSRDEQVLNLENPSGAAADAAPASTAGDGAQVRPLPQKRFGATVSSRTPVGTAHVTMNDDEDGNPLEVFVEIGRGGSELKAMAEAMGRLMSVLLRMVSALSPKERVAQIVDQLRGIGGSRSTAPRWPPAWWPSGWCSPTRSAPRASAIRRRPAACRSSSPTPASTRWSCIASPTCCGGCTCRSCRACWPPSRAFSPASRSIRGPTSGPACSSTTAWGWSSARPPSSAAT